MHRGGVREDFFWSDGNTMVVGKNDAYAVDLKGVKRTSSYIDIGFS